MLARWWTASPDARVGEEEEQEDRQPDRRALEALARHAEQAEGDEGEADADGQGTQDLAEHEPALGLA